MMLPIPVHQIQEVVLFLDQSTTKVGYSILENGVVTAYGTHNLGSHRDIFTRVRAFEALIGDFIASVAPDKVYCEGGTYSGSNKSREACRALATVEYLVAEACHRHTLPFDTINNSTLKASACRIARVERAKGDKGKDPVGEAVRKFFHVDLEVEIPPDTADAIAMAMVYAHGEHIPLGKRPKPVRAKQPAPPGKGKGRAKVRKSKAG
jgi:Holliday junction resolvasome RuvABC endonuclease subunit